MSSGISIVCEPEIEDLEGDILVELTQKIECDQVDDPVRMAYSIARFRITDRLRRRIFKFRTVNMLK